MKKCGQKILGGLFLALMASACTSKEDFSKNFTQNSPNESPIGYIDGASFIASEGAVRVAGWSADQEDGVPKKVAFYVDNKLAGYLIPQTFFSRPDVVKAYNNPAFDKSGFVFETKLPLSPGTHSAMAVAYDKEDGFKVLNNSGRTFTVN